MNVMGRMTIEKGVLRDIKQSLAPNGMPDLLSVTRFTRFKKKRYG